MWSHECLPIRVMTKVMRQMYDEHDRLVVRLVMGLKPWTQMVDIGMVQEA